MVFTAQKYLSLTKKSDSERIVSEVTLEPSQYTVVEKSVQDYLTGKN